MNANTPARRTPTQSAPPAKKPAEAEATVQSMIRDSWSAIAASLPDTMDSKRFARLVFNAVRKTPRLAEATATSMIGAVLTASALGLEIGLNNEAHLVPYKRTTKDKSREWVEAQLIVGYGGVVKLFQQHPAARGVTTGWVGRNDQFDYRYGTAAFLDHRPALGDRGEPIAFWAAYELANGTRDFLVLDPGTVAKLRDKPINETRDVADPEHWMERKTVLKQVLKLAPKSTKLQWAMAVDEKPGGELERERVAVAIAAGDVVPDQAQASIDPDVDDVEGDVVDQATGEVVVEDRGAGPVSEGTVGGGEATTVPAGAGQQGAGVRGAASTRTPAQTRPADEDSPASADANPEASQAGAGDVAAVPAQPAATSAPLVQEFDQGDERAVVDEGTGVERVHTPAPILTSQKNELRQECSRLGIQSVLAEKLMFFDMILGYDEGTVKAQDALNRVEAATIIEKLQSFPDGAALQAWGAGQQSLVEG